MKRKQNIAKKEKRFVSPEICIVYFKKLPLQASLRGAQGALKGIRFLCHKRFCA